MLSLSVAAGGAGLHPVFGPGEDRNVSEQDHPVQAAARLHPVFGPGEDRN